MLKRQKFRFEIRRKQVEANRKQIRVELLHSNKQSKQSNNEEDFGKHPQIVQFRENQDASKLINNQEINYSRLEEYSLMKNDDLWLDQNIIDSIFRILYEQIQNEMHYTGNKNYAIQKISSIFRKMLRNQIQWIPTKIQYIIIGSSICLPVYLTVLQCFSKTEIPAYKKIVANAMLKVARQSKNISEETTSFYENINKDSNYQKYLKILTRLYISTPRIKITTDCQILRPLLVFVKYQFQNSPKPNFYLILLNKNLLYFIACSLTPMIEQIQYSQDTILSIISIIINEWSQLNMKIDSEVRLYLYNILEQISELASFSTMLSFIHHNLNIIMEVFQKQLCCCATTLNTLSQQASKFSKNIILKQHVAILSALNSFLLSDDELCFIQFSYSNERLQECFENIIKNVKKLCLNQNSQLYQQFAYFCYYLIVKLQPQHLEKIISYQKLNEIIYQRLQITFNVSQIIIWLKVFQALVSMVITQQLQFQYCIEERTLNKVKWLFSQHEHQEVTKITESILETIACVNELEY